MAAASRVVDLVIEDLARECVDQAAYIQDLEQLLVTYRLMCFSVLDGYVEGVKQIDRLRGDVRAARERLGDDLV